MIEWHKISRQDDHLIKQIVERALAAAEKNGHKLNFKSLQMDICATHLSCPLKLGELLRADSGSFGHDVWGIRQHIDRKTGKLQHCFLPRFVV